MSKNFGRIIEPFNWQEIVTQAKSIRKQQGLTQKEHAAMAGVSVPTMISFDRAEKTLSIEKVLDILNVVGMVAKSNTQNSNLNNFILDAKNRWLELISDKRLKDNPEVKQLFGNYSVGFSIDGELKKIKDLSDFLNILDNVSKIKYSGWSPFWIAKNNPNSMPYFIDENTIECWVGKKHLNEKNDWHMNQKTQDDFWRMSKLGFGYLQRAYEEDIIDMLEPGVSLCVESPIRDITEIICYTDRLKKSLSLDSTKSKINLSIFYTGLKGRVLTNYRSPRFNFIENKISMFDECESDIEFNLPISNNHIEVYKEISEVVMKLLKGLYYRFNFDLQHEFVENLVKKMSTSHLR
jgi:transcriptional regulator with XRE-family HTH domain